MSGREKYYYILTEDKKVKPVTVSEWATWFEKSYDKRLIDRTSFEGLDVSTVFIGVDHRFIGNGPPLIFETMIFSSKYEELDNYIERYSTYEEAKLGHLKIVQRVESKITRKVF